MEISFTEFDELKEEGGVVEGEEENYQYNNYWTNEISSSSTNTNTKSKKKVSYDDILSSLNMVVHKGVLQFAKQKPVNTDPPKQQQHQQQQQQWQQQQTSYIHNKYFQPQQQQEQPRRPMTREEYIRDYNARIVSQRRIAQIKSKKLLFDTQHINVSPSQNPRDMNKLFATRFRM